MSAKKLEEVKRNERKFKPISVHFPLIAEGLEDKYHGHFTFSAKAISSLTCTKRK